MEVLDTSAFIHEYTTDDTVVSVPEVHEELTGEGALRFDAMEGSGMTIHVPAPEVLDNVRARCARGSARRRGAVRHRHPADRDRA